MEQIKITKIAISPKSKYVVTYSQEDNKSTIRCYTNEIGSEERFIPDNEDQNEILDDQNEENPLISLTIDQNEGKPDNSVYFLDGLLNLKVSDKKIIIYENEKNEIEIYDMNNREKIILDANDIAYKFTNFLTNGDLVIYKFDRDISKSIILIYPSHDIKNKKYSKYEFNEKEIIFGGIINDKLWILSNKSIFVLDLLDLSALQHRKIPLEINEDIEMISLKLSESLMVIKVDKMYYIYSTRMDFLIKSIEDSGQEFNIVNDEYIIILSNDDELINIYSWKSNLKASVNFKDVVNDLIKSNGDSGSFNIIHKSFNNKKAIVKGEKLLLMINMENYNWKPHVRHILDDSHDDIFYNIEKQFIVPVNDEDELDEFIKKYISPNLKNFGREQNDYEISRSMDDFYLTYNDQCQLANKMLENNDDNDGDIILEAVKELVSSYNTNLNTSLKWKYSEINKNTYILYNETELHIYTFNMNTKKMKLQCRYNCQFFKHAIKFYKNEKLKIKEINEIAQHTGNNRLKKQWVLYLLGQEYFLVYYGEKLLKSAIKKNNIEIVEMIFNKTLEYFRKNPKNNIHILSIICRNMKYLDENYSDFFLRYYNEINLFMDDSNSDIIHNNFQHLRSFHKELNIIKTSSFLYSSHNIIFVLYHLFWKLCVGLFISILLLFMAWKFNDPLNKTSIIINIIIGSLSIIFIICLFLFIMYLPSPKNKPMLTFVVPFPGYMTYPKKYYWLKEFFRPSSSPFSQTQNNKFYKTWNGEAIINFKWRVFGRYYYAIIWILFIIYLTCFTLASIPSDIFNEKVREKLFIYSIILGLIHVSFKFRQFIWNPIMFISDIWNWLDLGAYLVPVFTSVYWISSDTAGRETMEITQAVSISCLLLDIKFLLFFRAFESFGIYFAIILGVAKRIISFLFIIFIIIISFAHTFLILLRPKLKFSKDDPGDLNDQNNPWSHTKQYHQISEDGKIINIPFLIEEPDENTNLFSNFPDSLLAMYLFLTGDRGSLTAWTPNDNPIMIILMIIFSFVIVVFLMNLFIGLLNIAIEADNDRASYLAQKAEILKEIELFYLFPHQRRWKTWFPDIIYYYADVNKTRQAIKKLEDEGTWKTNHFPKMRENLLNLFKNS